MGLPWRAIARKKIPRATMVSGSLFLAYAFVDRPDQGRLGKRLVLKNKIVHTSTAGEQQHSALFLDSSNFGSPPSRQCEIQKYCDWAVTNSRVPVDQ